MQIDWDSDGKLLLPLMCEMLVDQNRYIGDDPIGHRCNLQATGKLGSGALICARCQVLLATEPDRITLPVRPLGEEGQKRMIEESFREHQRRLAEEMQAKSERIERQLKGKKMDDETRRSLKAGDQVTVRMDDGQCYSHHVRVAPWMLPNGVWIVGLDKIPGGYLLDRVEAIEIRHMRKMAEACGNDAAKWSAELAAHVERTMHVRLDAGFAADWFRGALGVPE